MNFFLIFEQTRAIFLQWLPWCLRMSRPNRKITLKTIRMSNKMKQMELKDRTSKSLLANVLDLNDDFRHYGGCSNAATMNNSYLRNTTATSSMHHAHTTTTSSGALSLDEASGCSVAQRDLQLILREIQFITNKMRRNEEEQDIISDWKFAAIVMDRFCLIVFTLFTMVATLVVLLSAPHIIVQ